MIRVTFISADDQEQIVNVRGGVSVQEAAIQNDVIGIDADCGGAAPALHATFLLKTNGARKSARLAILRHQCLNWFLVPVKTPDCPARSN